MSGTARGVEIKTFFGTITYNVPPNFRYDRSTSRINPRTGLREQQQLVRLEKGIDSGCRGCVFNGGDAEIVEYDPAAKGRHSPHPAVKCEVDKYVGQTVMATPPRANTPGQNCARGLTRQR